MTYYNWKIRVYNTYIVYRSNQGVTRRLKRPQAQIVLLHTLCTLNDEACRLGEQFTDFTIYGDMSERKRLRAQR